MPTIKKRHNSIATATKRRKDGAQGISEKSLHKQIAQYLTMVIRPPSFWQTVEVSNNRGGVQASYNQRERKEKGVITGYPDIEIFWRGEFENTKLVCLEIKIPGEKAKPHQEEIHMWLRVLGHQVYVVHSIDEVTATLKKVGII